MQKKIENIVKVNNDLTWLKDEYEAVSLRGSCPNGDVLFEAFLEWVSKNDHLLGDLIALSTKLKEL
jgi:hypothetical protein